MIIANSFFVHASLPAKDTKLHAQEHGADSYVEGSSRITI